MSLSLALVLSKQTTDDSRLPLLSTTSGVTLSATDYRASLQSWKNLGFLEEKFLGFSMCREDRTKLRRRKNILYTTKNISWVTSKITI